MITTQISEAKKFKFTTITAISDTHTKHKQLTKDLIGGDLLLHCGDFTSVGYKHEVESFINWFSKLDNYTHKVFIAGNHDLVFESEKRFDKFFQKFKHDNVLPVITDNKPQWLLDILANLPANVHYLENNSVTIDGVKIWGSPVSPTFANGWAFNVDRGYDINQVWCGIPDDSNIVMTHGPMLYHNDQLINTHVNIGCEQLYHRLLEVKPNLHFCGHIHYAYGYKRIFNSDGYSINASNLDESYQYTNTPVTLDYDFENRDLIDFVQ